MPTTEEHDGVPLLPEKSQSPPPRFSFFSRINIIILAILMQIVICTHAWAFAGVRIANKFVLLPDNVASWFYMNQSEATTIATLISTLLAIIGSFLLGITIQHALIYRLSRDSGGVRLLTATAWIQLARCVPFIQPRRHLWWTILSLIWIAVVHFLTTAWSNLLTPEFWVQPFPAMGQDVDLVQVSPAVLSDFAGILGLPHITPNTQNYSITPEIIEHLASTTSYLSEAGRAAILGFLNPGYPAFIDQYNSSTGGVAPLASIPGQLITSNASAGIYQGVSTFALIQQGFTANISCQSLSSSTTITLNNSASVPVGNPNSPANLTLETWSWNTNCSGNAYSSTGDVYLLMSNGSFSGNGLFATSVCLYHDFSGRSNQSFLVVMHSPNISPYSETIFATSPNLPIVCQITPMVTMVQVQYSENGLVNVSSILNQTMLPDEAWPLVQLEGCYIWAAFCVSQGLYSNLLADTLLEAMPYMVPIPPADDVARLVEIYLRGIFEYLGTDIRNTIDIDASQIQLPLNTSYYTVTGTMSISVAGWKFRLRAHGIALAVITLVTFATAASGIFALLEAKSQKKLRDSLERGSAALFDVTSLMDVLLASSKGNLARALSEREAAEEQEKLVVDLVVNGDKPVLNVRADTGDDAGEGGPA